MSNREDLKPCPFCGGEACQSKWQTESYWSSNIVWFSQVACTECEVAGQSFCDDPDGDEAKEFWNTRA